MELCAARSLRRAERWKHEVSQADFLAPLLGCDHGDGVVGGFPVVFAADMKAEDVVARHLDSIGTAEARAAAKSRIVQGTSLFKILVGGGGELQGTSALVSEGRKSVLMIKLANSDYRGEQFVTDGEKVSVAATTSSHKWSDFGEFVRAQDQVVREGLLGGELTTAWALLNLAENKAKLNFDGEKKVDGRPAYQLTYHSKKRDDLTIHLYFDPQTFQHIMTTYAITLASGLGGLFAFHFRSGRADHIVQPRRARTSPRAPSRERLATPSKSASATSRRPRA